jgi:hypothetical protein
MRIKFIALALAAVSAVALMLTGDSPERTAAQGTATSAIVISSNGTAPNGNYSQTEGSFIRVVAGTPTPTPTPGPTPCTPVPASPGGVFYLGNYTLSNGEEGTFVLNVTNGTNEAFAGGSPDEFPDNPVVVEQGPATVTAQVSTTTGFGNGAISFTSSGTNITGTITFFSRFAYDPSPGQTCTGATPTPTPAPSPSPIASPTPTPSPGQTVTVAGRVTTPSGQGLRNATVTMTDSLGVPRIATTSSFGNYSFSGVAPNQMYILNVRSKRYRFAPQFTFVQGNMSNVDLVGLE